jgi:hypothetical protein
LRILGLNKGIMQWIWRGEVNLMLYWKW